MALAATEGLPQAPAQRKNETRKSSRHPAQKNLSSGDDVIVKAVRQGTLPEIRYRYKVENRTADEIVLVMIGVDFRTDGEPHLTRLPKDWKRATSSFRDYGWTIDEYATRGSEKGWVPLIMFFEERDAVAMTWMVEDLFGFGIGADSGGAATFEINVGNGEDRAYETGPWTVIFADGRMLTGTIRK